MADQIFGLDTNTGTEDHNYMVVNDDGSINTRQFEIGVPFTYTKQTASGDNFILQKGQLNKLRLRPQVMNEHAESSRNIHGVVSDGNILGQIFKASHDNINGIDITVESAAGVNFDDFESYADDAALQAVWIATGDDAEIETSEVYEGDQSMYLPAEGNNGDEWARAFATTDFTGYTGEFWMYSNKEYKDVKMRVFVEDSAGNTNSQAVVQPGKKSWYKFVIIVDEMTADGGTPADTTDIVKIGYRVQKEKRDGYVILDDLISVPPPGELELKLWDMGTTMPVSGTTALDDGTQYTKLGDAGITGKQEASVIIDLYGGKRAYHIDEFVAGPATEIPTNEILNVGHYYAITMHYVNTNVSVYGTNEAWDDYYKNGYAFSAPDDSTAITTAGANKDLMFVIFSTQDVYVFEITSNTDGTPNGNSETTLYVEDNNMIRTNVLTNSIKAVPTVTTRMPRPFFMGNGAKLEQEYNDDITDDVSSINLIISYFFIPPTVNG